MLLANRLRAGGVFAETGLSVSAHSFASTNGTTDLSLTNPDPDTFTVIWAVYENIDITLSGETVSGFTLQYEESLSSVDNGPVATVVLWVGSSSSTTITVPNNSLSNGVVVTAVSVPDATTVSRQLTFGDDLDTPKSDTLTKTADEMGLVVFGYDGAPSQDFSSALTLARLDGDFTSKAVYTQSSGGAVLGRAAYWGAIENNPSTSFTINHPSDGVTSQRGYGAFLRVS